MLSPTTIIGGASATRSRTKNDFYPTPRIAIDTFLKKWQPSTNAKLFEPCGGNGALIDGLTDNGFNVVGSCDIDPQRKDILKQDFLKLKSLPVKADTIITNPPFNLAEEFVRKSFELGIETVAILIKATWFSAAKRIDLFENHRPSKKLDYTFRLDFMGKGSPVMECCWIVWEGQHSNVTEYDLIKK